MAELNSHLSEVEVQLEMAEGLIQAFSALLCCCILFID